MQLVNEECGVCWRVYSQEIVPVALVCGHSFCQQCSSGLNKCPLCRKRFQSGTKPTNYSLLSLVNRVNQVGHKETRDVEIQTEKPVRQTRSVAPQNRETVTPGLALTLILKLTTIQQKLLDVAKAFSN